MLIYSWFFKQAVTEENMNDAFGAVQSSMFNLMTDQKLVGLAQGGTPGPTTPTANLSIVIGGPTYAYDQLGERIYAPTFSADCSKDLNNVSTAVSGAGNEKYLSVFVLFERTLSDPVIDGNGMTVYYVQAESYIYEVYQGAEAPVGTATHPALINPGLLVADVHLIFGQTQIMSGDISTSRAQATFNFVQSPFSILAGNVPDAIEAMLTDLNQHVNSIGTAHPATAISATAVAGSPYSLASGTVESQLTALIGELNTRDATLIGDINTINSELAARYAIVEILSTSSHTATITGTGVAQNVSGWAIAFHNCETGDILEVESDVLQQYTASGATGNWAIQFIASGAAGNPIVPTFLEDTADKSGVVVWFHFKSTYTVLAGDSSTITFQGQGISPTGGSGSTMFLNAAATFGKHYRLGFA